MADPLVVPNQELLESLYRAFNERDIELALAYMHADVDWPNGMEGGWVHGPDEIRAYWTRQWATLDPRVEPQSYAVDDAGRTVVAAHQVVRERAGALVADTMIEHAYTIAEGLVRRMDIRKL